MRCLLLSLALSSLILAHAAAAPPTEAILAEGLRLYQSECSAWVATDLMLASTIDRAQVGGYLSYFRGDSVCTIFWAKEVTGTPGAPLLGSYVFPRQDVRVETSHFQPAGQFTAAEARLFAIRQAALVFVNDHQDEFTVPANTSLNIDLLDAPKGGTRVYLLTGPQQGGVVPIGNDHLLTFDQNGKLTASERLHNSYLPLRWATGKDSVKVKGLVHSHLAAHPYITPTDICSALLYRPADCTEHVVVSQDYVSIFNLEQKQLAILTRKAYERIANFRH